MKILKNSSKTFIIGITGATSMPYAIRLLEVIACDKLREKFIQENIRFKLHVILSRAAVCVLKKEHQISFSYRNMALESLGVKLYKTNQSSKDDFANVVFHHPDDISASIASGSDLSDGMIIIPCSMNSLASIANGICLNLIHRAADVCLKEKRPLIMAVRESPLSSIHINNMLKVSQCGGIVAPITTCFYAKPKKIEDLIDNFVGKILDLMGVKNSLIKRWINE